MRPDIKYNKLYGGLMERANSGWLVGKYDWHRLRALNCAFYLQEPGIKYLKVFQVA